MQHCKVLLRQGFRKVFNSVGGAEGRHFQHLMQHAVLLYEYKIPN